MWFQYPWLAVKLMVNTVLTASYQPPPLSHATLWVVWLAGWPCPPNSIKSPAQAESPLVTYQNGGAHCMPPLAFFVSCFSPPLCLCSGHLRVFSIECGAKFFPQCVDPSFVPVCRNCYCDHSTRGERWNNLVRIQLLICGFFYFILTIIAHPIIQFFLYKPLFLLFCLLGHWSIFISKHSGILYFTIWIRLFWIFSLVGLFYKQNFPIYFLFL